MMSWYDVDKIVPKIKCDNHPLLLTHLDQLSCSLGLLTTPATDCWARVIPAPDRSSCRAWGRTPSVSPRCLATANFLLLKKGAFCNLSEMETLCHYISCAGGSCCGAGYRCSAAVPVQLTPQWSWAWRHDPTRDTELTDSPQRKFEESLNSAFLGSHCVTFLGKCAMFPSQNA